ncbi:MAG: hypothetical protein QM532_00655 [Cyanobium sp. MAG06]|nr:hypothetical protein [Cyanobium sp. MAG06]
MTIIDKSNNPAFNNANDNSFIFSLLKEAGYANNKDSDNDGIPDIADNKPFDSNNLSNLNIKEIFYNDLGIADKIYD